MVLLVSLYGCVVNKIDRSAAKNIGRLSVINNDQEASTEMGRFGYFVRNPLMVYLESRSSPPRDYHYYYSSDLRVAVPRGQRFTIQSDR